MIRSLERRQPEMQPVIGSGVIDSVEAPSAQREIRLLSSLTTAKWVPAEVVGAWETYRDAVSWCWDHQRHFVGIKEQARQTLFANAADMHAPHASRCLKADSKAPMELPDRCINAFESFTGWRGIRQWQAKSAQLTLMEQVIAERAA